MVLLGHNESNWLFLQHDDLRLLYVIMAFFHLLSIFYLKQCDFKLIDFYSYKKIITGCEWMKFKEKKLIFHVHTMCIYKYFKYKYTYLQTPNQLHVLYWKVTVTHKWIRWAGAMNNRLPEYVLLYVFFLKLWPSDFIWRHRSGSRVLR